MKPSLWQRLDQIARNLVPILVILALVLITVVPLGLPAYAPIGPMLPVIGITYWAIVRPDIVRPTVAFAIGLVEDILVGTPLGLNALVLLAVHAVVVAQQRFFLGKPFHVWWWAFCVVAAAAALIKWGVFVVLTGAVVDPKVVLVGYLVTVALYPLLGRLFARLELALAKEG